MAADRADVLSLVKTRIGITGNARDGLIGGYVDEIGQRILNDCNIQEMPDGLKYTWISMTIDLLKVEQQSIPEIAAISPTASEVKIGDTTTKEAPGSAAPKSALNSIVLNYEKDLGCYRKLRW